MITHPLKSNVIESCAYDEEAKELTLDFKSGGSHKYSDVPKEVFEGICSADSAGKYFHSQIRGKYPSERV